MFRPFLDVLCLTDDVRIYQAVYYRAKKGRKKYARLKRLVMFSVIRGRAIFFFYYYARHEAIAEPITLGMSFMRPFIFLFSLFRPLRLIPTVLLAR